jgi:hypothetical protein
VGNGEVFAVTLLKIQVKGCPYVLHGCYCIYGVLAFGNDNVVYLWRFYSCAYRAGSRCCAAENYKREENSKCIASSIEKALWAGNGALRGIHDPEKKEANMLKVQKYLLISAGNALGVVCLLQFLRTQFYRRHSGQGKKVENRIDQTLAQSVTMLDKVGACMHKMSEYIKNRNKHCCS